MTANTVHRAGLYLQMGAGFTLYVITVFFRQLDRLFGSGVLRGKSEPLELVAFA